MHIGGAFLLELSIFHWFCANTLKYMLQYFAEMSKPRVGYLQV